MLPEHMLMVRVIENDLTRHPHAVYWANMFSYVGNDPINSKDPDGRMAEEESWTDKLSKVARKAADSVGQARAIANRYAKLPR